MDGREPAQQHEAVCDAHDDFTLTFEWHVRELILYSARKIRQVFANFMQTDARGSFMVSTEINPFSCAISLTLLFCGHVSMIHYLLNYAYYARCA